MFGRRLFIGTSATVGGFWTAFYLLPNTVRADELKRSMQMKIDDADVPVHPKLINLLSEVSRDLKLDNEEKKMLKPFMTNGLDVVPIGLLQPFFKLHLGIPEFFLLENMGKMNITGMINDLKIPSDSTDAEKFKSSLVLSKEAKKFALCQRIIESQSKTFWLVGFLPVVLSAFASSNYKIFFRRNQSNVYKIFFISQLFFLCFWTFIMVKDISHFYKKASADLQAASLSLEYVDGGIEFYEKLSEKYNLIKKFLPDYKNSDTDYKLFHLMSLDIDVRIKYLKDLKHAMETNTEMPSVWHYLMMKEKTNTDLTAKSFKKSFFKGL